MNIDYTDNYTTIRNKLNSDVEYQKFVQSSCTHDHIFIKVGAGHIVLWHNNNDVFTSFLLPYELFYFRSNIDDICRIANLIQNFTTNDYKASNNT